MGSFWGAVVGAICAVIVTILYQQWRSNVIVSRALFKACQKTKKDFAMIANGYYECVSGMCTYSLSLEFLMKNNVLQSDAEHDVRAILETESLFNDQDENVKKMVEKVQELTQVGMGIALNHPGYYTNNTLKQLVDLKNELAEIIGEIRSRAIQEAKKGFFEYCLSLIKRAAAKSKKILAKIYEKLTNLPGYIK